MTEKNETENQEDLDLEERSWFSKPRYVIPLVIMVIIAGVSAFLLTRGPGGDGGGGGQSPTAFFSPSSTSLTAGESVDFLSTSVDPDGTIITWLWDFGDGTTSTEQNPTHLYLSPGEYTVKLTVTDDDGNTSSYSVDIIVTEGQPTNQTPTADFTYSPSSPTTDNVIQFTDTSTDPDGTIVSWSWNFGNGYSSTSQNPTHQYSSPGTYTVTLTVTDDDGNTDSYSVDITVTEGVGGISGDYIDPATTSAGDVWFSPETGTLSGTGTAYSDEVHVNSGTQKLGAYSFIITYNENIILVDNTKGAYGGVDAGTDGFVTVVNTDTPGTLVVNGFDINGTGPGNDLHVLTIYWTTTGTGTTTLDLTVTNLTDETGTTIGTPNGINGERTVE